MKKVKIRYRKNSNGTSSIRLNFFNGYEKVNGKKKAKRFNIQAKENGKTQRT